MKEYLLRKQPSPSEIATLASELGSTIIATIYWHKGVKTHEEISHFLSYEDLLPITELFDVAGFYEKLSTHREKKSKVVIYGDYDADGAVAAAILWRFLSKVLKMDATVYIPDRHEEGYGLNEKALLDLSAQGTGLVITVDCGVRDAALIAKIHKDTKMDIMVTDHHQPGDTFPQCVTVHPMFPEHESKNLYISGGVVVWKLVRYLEQKSGLSHEFSESVIDLAGTSLVTDIMPLTGENRVILRRALQKMRRTPSLGIKVLAEITQTQISQLAAYHLGYIIGPRLNASGRIGNQYTSTRLLSTDNAQKAQEFAQEVHTLNVKRQDITKRMLDEAKDCKQIIEGKLVIAAGEGWDDGVIGLVAGKLMNSLNLPAIAISIDTEKKVAKGSARSFGEFDMTGFLSKNAEVLERFGGHHNAAGFTLKGIDISTFKEHLAKTLKNEYSDYVPRAKVFVDTYVSVNDFNEDFFTKLADLEPFGQANAAPIFALKGVVSQFSMFGKEGTHVKIDLQADGGTIKCLAFDAQWLQSKLEQGRNVIVVGKPKLEEYQGRKQLSFFIEDVLDVLPEE